MNLITYAIFTYSIATQITLITPLNSSSNVSSTPGCYSIQPSISEVKGAEGYMLEFYNNYNCKGTKIEEFKGDSVFKPPIFAISLKVSISLHNIQTSELESEEVIKDNNINSLNYEKRPELLDKEKVNTNEADNPSSISIDYTKFNDFKASIKRRNNVEISNKEASHIEYCEEGSEMDNEECVFVDDKSFSTQYESDDDWKNRGPDFEDKAFDISNRPIENDTDLVGKFSYIFNFLQYFFQ